jgi:TonB family protein
MKYILKLSALQISILGHFLVGLIILLFVMDLGMLKSTKKINFDVIENPIVMPPNLNLQIKNETKPQKPPEVVPDNTQKVFGVSRKAITTTDSNAVSVKQGNTVVKENDDLTLKDSDADSLPIPADDYLITSGVQLISTVIANRTDEARKAGYTGTAVLLILIDKEGIVREVKLLNKLDFGLDERALEIGKTLKFIPAKIKEDAVATKIRFSINFKSSN